MEQRGQPENKNKTITNKKNSKRTTKTWYNNINSNNIYVKKSKINKNYSLRINKYTMSFSMHKYKNQVLFALEYIFFPFLNLQFIFFLLLILPGII